MKINLRASSSDGVDGAAVGRADGSHHGQATFGMPMRQAHFNFAPSYTPLNHGSFGTFPSSVRDRQRTLRDETEARPDTSIRFAYPELLRQAREAVAPLLGAATDEVVLLPNATTAINAVLRNLCQRENVVVLYFSTIYPSCLKTIQSLEEETAGAVTSHCINLAYPVEDYEIIDRFRAAIESLTSATIEAGGKATVAVFDTVLTFPGVRFPWEPLVRICKEYGVTSCVDGAHGVGHIDLTLVSREGPDFFVSNCYKWLFVPRGCSVLYVPYRNQALIRTTYPTAEGFLPEAERRQLKPSEYFVHLFDKIATTDTTPYMCVPEALKFREEVCGGEERVRDYCTRIARDGGERMAAMLGTRVLENRSGTLRRCCFANVQLPLKVKQEVAHTAEVSHVDGVNGQSSLPAEEAHAAADWITMTSVNEFDTFIATRYYGGAFWVRISGQVYLELRDFEWAATILLDLCDRVRSGRWKEGRHSIPVHKTQTCVD